MRPRLTHASVNFGLYSSASAMRASAISRCPAANACAPARFSSMALRGSIVDCEQPTSATETTTHAATSLRMGALPPSALVRLRRVIDEAEERRIGLTALPEIGADALLIPGRQVRRRLGDVRLDEALAIERARAERRERTAHRCRDGRCLRLVDLEICGRTGLGGRRCLGYCGLNGPCSNSTNTVHRSLFPSIGRLRRKLRLHGALSRTKTCALTY